MLKLLTIVLWVTPSIVLFLYLLWISKRSPRPGNREGVQAASAEIEAIDSQLPAKMR